MDDKKLILEREIDEIARQWVDILLSQLQQQEIKTVEENIDKN